MTLTAHIEHEVVNGKTVLETFEGVETIRNPPSAGHLQIVYADGEKSDEKLTYGTIVEATND